MTNKPEMNKPKTNESEMNEPEKTNKFEKMSETEREMADIKNLSDERHEERVEIETMSTNPNPEDGKRPKACDEDPYIVKLFKSLIHETSGNSSERGG